jgi:hypothetical protein
MYQKLLSIGQVALVPLAPLRPPYPSLYKPHITCEYLTIIARHNIHTYNAFKKKLLQLIKASWIMYEETPNVSTVPLHNHVSGSGSVNVLEAKWPRNSKVLMDRIYEMLIKAGYKEGTMNFYKYHGEEGYMINQCWMLLRQGDTNDDLRDSLNWKRDE